MTTVEPERIQGLGKSVMGGKDVLGLPPGLGDGRGGGSSPGGAQYPHIDDIVAVPRDIHANQSIKKLIEMAEAGLRQAEMARDFNRPAIALKDYLRAFIIAVQFIPNHRDYPSLKGDRRELWAAHNALLKKITQQEDDYGRIKQDIIADNKRSGIKPSHQRQDSQLNGEGSQPMSPSGSSERDMPASLPDSVNGSPRSNMNGSPGRSKPTVQPKPKALHGNAIKPNRASFTAAQITTQDLAARFANLRGPQASPGQDPRIKTHALVPIPPKPAGPREMPQSQKPKIGIDSSVPTLPKMPDAIYSPARGSISGEAPRLSAATPRGLYGRTSSSASIAGTPTGLSSSQSNDYFPTQSYSNYSIPPTPPSLPMKIPEGDCITPEELYQAMKGKGSILLIDVRSRDEFDEGHILSPSTICIEPSILLRENISSEEICESLVISPGKEQSHFSLRHKFDLVVFYDHDSERIPSSPRNSDDIVIVSLNRALLEFNYGQELKNIPKLLKGGLEAWVDLMGQGSLQSTPGTAPQTSRSLDRPGYRHRTIERQKSRYVIKPLKPDEVEVWKKTLENEDMQTATSPTFSRSTEDFLRRFPPVAMEQESMTSPKIDVKPNYGLSHKVDFSDLPSPPTRPAPAVPRASVSSLSQSGDASELYDNGDAALVPRTTGRSQPKSMEQQSTGDSSKFYTGLNNPHNWCYANSTLQSLLASPTFGRLLADSEWMSKYKAPRKEDEKIDNPQLMMRIMTNLFHWMSTGKFQVMKAQTLMDYSRHLCTPNNFGSQFGGTKQQDANEFMTFLLEHIHDETNTRRDRNGLPPQPDTKRQPLLLAAHEYWHKHLETSRSIVDRYWRGLSLSTVECQACSTKTYRYDTFETTHIPVGNKDMKFTEALEKYGEPETIADFSCDRCRRSTDALRTLTFARMPLLLCVTFSRFQVKPNGEVQKSTSKITWDFDDLDFTPFFIPPDTSKSEGVLKDIAFKGPFKYQCYAVIVHSGPTINGGHYYTYVRDWTSHDPYAWWCCNDSQVTKVRIGSNDRYDCQSKIFRSGADTVPYVAFFARKNVTR